MAFFWGTELSDNLSKNRRHFARDFGTQPLETLMAALNLTNTDLVAASSLQLTHKVVAKGRKGRKLTPNARNKILAALHVLRPEKKFGMKDLFNY